MLECPVSRKLILEKNFDLDFVNFKDYTGKTGFILACEYGGHFVVEYMVNSDLFSEETIISFLTTRNEDGRTGFMLACMENHQEVVKVMLECPFSKKLILENSLD